MPHPNHAPLVRAAGALATTALLTAGLASCAAQADAAAEGIGTETSDRLGAVAEAPVSVADEDPTDPSTWVISNGAVGDIRIGEDFDAAVAVADGEWAEIDACSAVWHSADYDVTFATDGTEIAAITVTGELAAPTEAPTTPEGLGLGSTRDEVRSVYPDAAESSRSDEGAVVLHPDAVDLAGADIAFELSASGRVTAITLSAGASADGGC